MLKIRGNSINITFTALFTALSVASVYIGIKLNMEFNHLIHFFSFLILGVVLDIAFTFGIKFKKDRNIFIKSIVNGILSLIVLAASYIYVVNAYSYWGDIQVPAGEYFSWATMVAGAIIIVTVIIEVIRNKVACNNNVK